jgi:ATP adenylyltransferase
MVLCPRTSEGAKIKSDSGELIGPISLNGTVLGGTLLVKSEAEWDTLRNDESRLEEVLKSIGIDSTIPTPNERL